ncbi:hypothetical protein Kfla_5639 [Kribbella flavida DSM 17836]|uniref:Uncharacterized protein n=1 Tax=Kribbella flavida (strain DSM 17836 / JCM 10339 / NBRC 14399) TaxID=479435 RepID=D2PP49_KRIFD|nr:hypothetical protein [Kribbella flavida]ADB34645.1 hypothetical protein Kfla_5639 [Kribbella flavida DSM 17836]
MSLKQDMAGWAQEMRTRAANPDLDNALRLLQTGRGKPGQGLAAGGAGEATRNQTPYERGRDSDRGR